MMSNNISGVTGVRRIWLWSGGATGSKTKKLWYWKVHWCDENGKVHEKSFPINTYGEDEAKQLAIAHRSEQIRLLEINFGIKYSDRHGL